MATNKRKEAAALFELLDKSTLKVPKNGSGSLKIPSWWSSKTNPTPAENKGAEKLAGKAVEAPSAAVVPAESKALSDPAPAVVERGLNGNGVHAAVKAEAATMVSPAIRPPGRALFSSPGGAVVPPAAEKFEPTPRPMMHANSAPQVFGPNTMHPGTSVPARRKSAAGGAIGETLAKVPLWAWAVLAIPVLLIVVIVAYVADPLRSSTKGTGVEGKGTSSLVVPNPDEPVTHVPAPVPEPTRHVEGPAQQPQPEPDTPQPAAKGQIVSAGQIDWKAHKYFLVVATFTRLDVANRGAAFLAEHGVDCTVVKDRKGNYLLIAAAGMNRQADPAALELRDRVVQIGRVHPDAIRRHTGRGVWDDAYYYNVSK